RTALTPSRPSLAQTNYGTSLEWLAAVRTTFRLERSTPSKAAVRRHHTSHRAPAPRLIKRPGGWPRAPALKVCTGTGPMRENGRAAKGLTGARHCDGSPGRLPVPAHA